MLQPMHKQMQAMGGRACSCPAPCSVPTTTGSGLQHDQLRS